MIRHAVRTSCVLVASSSVALVTYRLLRWRARKRARLTVERAENTQREGPLIDCENSLLCEKILQDAMRRASKWMTLYKEDEAKPMVGQVGGASTHKKPVLTLKPDYVLKPLITDHRGIREIAFYEAVKAIKKTVSSQWYANFLSSRRKKELPLLLKIGDLFDTFALALAMSLKDPVVVQSEKALKCARKKLKREVEALNNLAKFIPQYHGVLGQSLFDYNCRYGVSSEAHLLLHDLTINYSKPCVMDLKMGTRTFEPDAPPEKVHKESSKYAKQMEFGFRIVGMRVYDPQDDQADEEGYRFYDKQFGRSLETADEIVEAFRVFFSPESKTANEENDTDAAEQKFRSKSASNLLVQLRPLRKWFDENRSLTFCASSLLIIYEGDTRRRNGSSDAVTVKMIDFGRVRRHEGGDHGYRVGLKQLSHCVTQVLDRATEASPTIG